ncbi:MAG TPA: DNA-formamidopyrimidine glycosylase family protein, partial [Gammaproteobacteria bacterium]
MPELPDVEAYKRYLDATALHSAVEQVEVQAPEILEGTTPQGLGRALKGHVFANSRRHGKYLLVQLDDGPWLTLHFGMTGDLLYHRQDVNTPAHTQCRFSFGNGYELDYIAPRKLGHIG